MQLLITKKENEDLEKQVNKLMDKKYIIFLFLAILTGQLLKAQTGNGTLNNVTKSLPEVAVKDSIKVKGTDAYVKGKSYLLGGYTIKGLQKFSEESVKVFTGLRIDQPLKLPGDKLSSAIKKLYETKQFANIDVYVAKIDGNTAYLDIEVKELPQLNDVSIKGVKKSKAKEIKKEAKLKKGTMVTENLIVTTQNFVKKKYQDKGYLNAKATVTTRKDTSNTNAVNMNIFVDKGKRVKIKEIIFKGNKAFSGRKLRRAMKNTKRKNFFRFWKRSKMVEEKLEEDLEKIIEKYSEKGYRDARILGHHITKNDDNTINLHIDVDEGKKYYFGNISFLGNKRFSDELLERKLRLEKGETYNGKVLKERTLGNGKPDSDDISTLYQDNGYLYSRVFPVETQVRNDSIDVEIRIHEDMPFTIGNITLNGNDKTNDHVIFRELRVKPGYQYSKTDLIRSIREISQMGFFDDQKITPDIKPSYNEKKVDIDFSVAEKGSSQVELQGGYGGGSFIGTIGLRFNNFSIRNLFNKKAYRPLPMGDGQQLSLRLQKSRYYTTSSFSFTEPWLGGKRPQSFSFSVYHSSQYRYNYYSYKVDKNQRLNIVGLSLGLGRRLEWPDNFFTLSQSLSYQLYDLKNYSMYIGTLALNNGTLNNLSYSVTLSRNSSGPSLIYPTTGSNFSLTGKFTLPYSLMSDKDYSNLPLGEKYKWLEYYKVSAKGKWFTTLTDKLVLMTNAEFGYLGNYNRKLGDSPFERYFVGGDGMSAYQLDGRESIQLRGYENSRLSSVQGGTLYNKFEMELRYPITLKPMASIYVLGFLDAGNSYDDFYDYNPFDLKRSAGLGLRIFMPQFGLLGIDFGHGFDPLPGRTEKSGWQTHFVFGRQF